MDLHGRGLGQPGLFPGADSLQWKEVQEKPAAQAASLDSETSFCVSCSKMSGVFYKTPDHLQETPKVTKTKENLRNFHR